MNSFPRALLLSVAVAFGALVPPAAAAAARIAPKVIILAGFEVADDTGDAPGEFQYWVEREKLDGTLEVKGAPHPLRFNAAGVYGSVATNTRDRNLTMAQASELVMALCLDPRLDLTHTYWIVTGISGIDPAHGPIGSAVWAANVIDGDAMREISEKEMPATWPYGLFAIGTTAPDTLPPAHADAGGWGGATLAYTMNYALNPDLARWAFEFSRAHAKLDDLPALKTWREKYTAYPAAQRPPQILLGDTLASARYWHGEKRTEWARNWVKLWTGGKGVFSTTAMEQAAYVGTLQRLAAQGLLDARRILMLRGASNFCAPPTGQDVTTTIGDESLGTAPAFDALHRTGSVVIHEIVEHWSRYESTVPGN